MTPHRKRLSNVANAWQGFSCIITAMLSDSLTFQVACSGGAQRVMLTLTPAETVWLHAYRKLLETQFPEDVAEISIFGSKARGEAHLDSDLDVLVVIRDGDWHRKEALTCPGYDLAIGTEVVPSLHVYTVAEWEQLRTHASVFREVVERDRVTVP
jgi:predicted nucleotidyltransferase